MNITRRSLITTAMALPAAASLPFHSAHALPATLSVVVAISGLTTKTPTTEVAPIFKEFLKNGIPLTLGISMTADDGQPLKPDDDIADLLRKLSDDFPDHIEIVIELEDVSGLEPYFLLRRVSQAQSIFVSAFNPLGDYYYQTLLTGMSVMTSGKPMSKDRFAAIRAAGFRTIIHYPLNNDPQPESGKNWSVSPYVFSSNGVARLVGNRETSAIETSGGSGLNSPEMLKKTIEERISNNDPIILNIPIDALTGMSQSDAKKYVSKVSTMLHKLRRENRIWPLTPHTLYKSRHGGPHRYIIIRVDDHRIAVGKDKKHQFFIDTLLAKGIPLSDGVIPIGYGKNYKKPLRSDGKVVDYISDRLKNRKYEAAIHGYEHAHRELEGKTTSELRKMLSTSIKEFSGLRNMTAETLVPPNNVFSDTTLEAMSACGLKTISAEHGDYTWISGMDRYGVLHASNTINFEKNWTGKIEYWPVETLMEHFGPDNDAVFMIHPTVFDEPEKNVQVIDALQRLAGQRGTKLVNLKQYRKAVLPQIEPLELTLNSRYRATLFGDEKKDPNPSKPVSDVGIRGSIGEEKDPLTPWLRSQLMQDAETAWRFFEKAGTSRSLVPAASAWKEGRKIGRYQYVRMWDVGSIIMAALSAHFLGLIKQSEFEKRIKNALRFLKKNKFHHAGAALPNYESHISGGGKKRAGFDSADTGRLLICLKILDSYTNGAFGVDKIVKGWDFNKSILKGEMHDLRPGRSWSEHKNIYAKYASRGYELWGFEMNPVYEDPHPQKNMDSTMRFLQEVRKRGPIATEPNVTEEIELGFSEHSKLISEALFMAQIERYKETGKLTCTSEGPTDTPPWFAYQGYMIENHKTKWVVNSPFPNRKFETENFFKNNRMINSKGAFLWMAVRPEPYSEKLHAYIRKTAPLNNLGFASGVFEATDKKSLHSDGNTNGIILESIAYMINNRKPLIELSG